MRSSMMINVRLNNLMTKVYEELDEDFVRKNQNEIFQSLSYLEYLYLNQEFSSQQITFRSQRHFKNMLRDEYIYREYERNMSVIKLSYRYHISFRRIEQILIN